MKNKLRTLYNTHKTSIKKLIVLALIFASLKSLTYFSPIVLSTLTSPETFGDFEYSFNLGVALIGLFSFGLPSAYAFFILKNKEEKLEPLFHLHFLIMSLGLLLSVIFIPSLISNSIFGAFVIGVAIADQLLVSSILKSNGKNNLSVLTDTGVYIVLSILVLAVFLNLVDFSKELWFMGVLIYQIGFSVLFHGKYLSRFKEINKSLFAKVYGFGLVIVFASILFALVSNSTRLYIEHYGTLLDVGHYSFYFRLGAALLILYRLLSILLFRRLYLEDHAKLDTFFSWIILCLIGISLFIFGVFTFFADDIVPATNSFVHFKWLLPFCLFHILFWINAAFFEAIVIRENLVKQFVILLIVSLVLYIGTLELLKFSNSISLRTIIISNTVILFLTFLGQQFLLRIRRLSYPRTTALHLFLGGLYLLFIIFNDWS